MPKIPGQSLIPLVKHNAFYSNANITLSVLYTLVQIDLARHFVTAGFDDGRVQGDTETEIIKQEHLVKRRRVWEKKIEVMTGISGLSEQAV